MEVSAIPSSTPFDRRGAVSALNGKPEPTDATQLACRESAADKARCTARAQPRFTGKIISHLLSKANPGPSRLPSVSKTALSSEAQK